jgi:excinuclease UvrABC ATPase subunit
LNFWSSERHESLFSNGRVATKVSEAKITSPQITRITQILVAHSMKYKSNYTNSQNATQVLHLPDSVKILRDFGLDFLRFLREANRKKVKG